MRVSLLRERIEFAERHATYEKQASTSTASTAVHGAPQTILIRALGQPRLLEDAGLRGRGG